MKWTVTFPDGSYRSIESDDPPFFAPDGSVQFGLAGILGELEAAFAAGQWRSVELVEADVFGDATKAVS